LFTLSRNDAYDNVSEQDILRRNSIAFCLKNWGLIEVEDKFIEPHDSYVFVLPHDEKNEWTITHKINLFTLRNKNNFDIYVILYISYIIFVTNLSNFDVKLVNIFVNIC
jgi:hypothetical protein